MDYTKMKATKQTKQTPKNYNYNVSKKDTNTAKKALGKIGVSWILVLVFLLIGGGCGFLINKFAFKSDKFEMVAYASGEVDVCIGSDEELKTYTELGVKCIAFGKDKTTNVTISYYYRKDLTEDEIEVDKVNESVPGIYYAVYKSTSLKYKTVTLIRNIMVLGEEDNG